MNLFDTLAKVLCVVIAFVVAGSFSFDAKAGNAAIPPGNPRYLSFQIMNVESDDSYLPVMERAAAAGVNSFLLNVNWERVYGKRGDKANWDQIDKQADLAARLDCKIMLRIWVSRHNDLEWWPVETRPVSGDGQMKSLLGGFSFSDNNAIEEANGFVREVLEHFRPRQQAGQIVLVSVITTSEAEIGYNFLGDFTADGQVNFQLFDYGYYSKAAFRQWVQNKYRTTTNLNKAWSSDYSRFEDVNPPYTANDIWSGFYGNIGQDWYLFRHDVLKKLVTKFINTTKQVDPSYRYYQDMGSCYDGLSIFRATLGFKDLAKDADGLKINDHNSYPHRFAMDLLRSNLPGKIIGNEFENFQGDWKFESWRNHINQSYEHGADWVNIMGFDRLSNIEPIEGIIRETAAKWLTSPVQSIQTTQTVTYTLSEAIKRGTNDVRDKWQVEYNKTKTPIRVLLEEDLLGETTVENKPPIVNKAVLTQQAILSQWFQYEIPRDVFSDPDGFIAGITVTGLPSGISLVDWRLEGKAFTTSESTITITATDNSGAKVSTTFKFSVVGSPSTNFISLFKAGNFLTRRFMRYIQDGDTLRGEDIKETVNLMASPRSGSVGSYSFAMSGPYSIGSEDSQAPYGLFGDNGGVTFLPGRYQLTVKSYSGINLSSALLSQQVINFVVAEDLKPNNYPPFLVKEPGELFAKVGTAFSYRMSDSTFVDQDGTITSFTIISLPDGLRGDGTLITGTPTKKGIFMVKVRVTDNSDNASETTFRFTVSADNQPPVVVNSVADMTADVNTPFSYTIPENTFIDSDGQIVRITILGLPSGMSANGRLISGVPKTEGEQQIVVIATDDGNASAFLVFKLRILPEKQASRNQLPALIVAPRELNGRVGNPVYHRLSDSTFVDVDGYLTSFTITGLPDGLKGDGTLISGTPSKQGIFLVIVRVTDNAGGASETTFKFTISADNKPPVVSGGIPPLTAEVNKPYTFTVPENTFTDPDGKIAFYTIVSLPGGLTASGRVISGTPNKEGEYSSIAIATDDGNASAQLVFKIIVLPENKPPVVAKVIADQTTEKGTVYSYVIPKATFTDPDGQVVRLEVSGLPAGLATKGDTIQGIASVVGNFTVSIRAFDNKNASVQTTFKLTVLPENKLPVVAKTIPDQSVEKSSNYLFVVPKTTFSDPDGQVVKIEVSGLPTGILAQGDTIQGIPSVLGAFTVVVRAFDNKNASVQTTFKLTVLPENKPPFVAKIIGDQVSEKGVEYQFILPKETFVDPDGQIVRLEITGLPAGLMAKGDTILGMPTVIGDKQVSVRAFDNKNASVHTTFKLTVLKENIPPTANLIPTVVAIMGQVFSFDVKYYFKDSDGQIASVTYTSALPSGITANGSLLSGNPTAVGDYLLKVRAKDDRGASILVDFVLSVQNPVVNIFAYEMQGGPVRKIREITDGTSIPIGTLPAATSMFIESNATITAVTFEMTGPVNQTNTDNGYPFGLYGDAGSFKPVAGAYQLKVTALRNNTTVVTRTVKFTINPSGGRESIIESFTFNPFPDVELWKPYPNPFVNRVKVRMALDGYINPQSVEVTTANGSVMSLSSSMWKVVGPLLEVDLSQVLDLPGTYFLLITDDAGKRKSLRIQKAVDR